MTETKEFWVAIAGGIAAGLTAMVALVRRWPNGGGKTQTMRLCDEDRTTLREIRDALVDIKVQMAENSTKLDHLVRHQG